MNEFEIKYRLWHTYISYAKSALRIVACIISLYSLYISEMTAAVSILAIGLLLAEVLGIMEEWI